MKYKEYKHSRVCAIDFLPLFTEAVKDTLAICSKYGISSKRSADVSKFFYHYCLEKFCSGFKNCQSSYPKVIVVYPLPVNVNFNSKKLDKVLKVLPVPWCKCSSFQTPDVESACLNVLQKNGNFAKTQNFANKHLLLKFLKDFKKLKYFSNGSVDFNNVTE